MHMKDGGAVSGHCWLEEPWDAAAQLKTEAADLGVEWLWGVRGITQEGATLPSWAAGRGLWNTHGTIYLGGSISKGGNDGFLFELTV